jgi:hypothetical protein
MGSEMSVPGQANDPCPQDNAACVMQNGKAYAMCIDSKWAKTCDCIIAGSTTGTVSMPATMQPAQQCGDNMISGTEKCDGANLGTSTCQSLGYNGGGKLLCNNSCMYDVLMCKMTSGTSTGGTSGGAGMTGGGGSGGS